MIGKWFNVEQWTYGERAGSKLDGVSRLSVKAGPLPSERIVPPAGEEHAFDVARWQWDIEVYRSPKGRSIRVFVNGDEVPVEKRRKA